MSNQNNMVVYEDVYKAIEIIPTEEERQAAALVLLRYGCGGIEYEGENIYIKMIMQQAKIGIDKAKGRYNKATENGKKGGRTKQFNDDEILKLKAEGMTNKKVAEIIGCSEKTVERVNVAHRQNGQNENTDKTDKTEETDKTDTDGQNLNININNNSNSNTETTDFKNKITQYGMKLKTEEEKQTARNVITTYRNRGFDDEFIYYALQGLNGRNIIQYQGLLFSKNYQEQIYNTISFEHKEQEEKKKKATEIAAAVDKQFEKGTKIIKIESQKKPIDKGYINLNDITDD